MRKEFGCLGEEPKTKPFEFQQGTKEGMEEAGDSFHLGRCEGGCFHAWGWHASNSVELVFARFGLPLV